MIRNYRPVTWLILVIAVTSNHLVLSYVGDRDIRYDPEQQDGIPVISSRSLAPTIKGRYDDHASGADFEPANSQRRNSDADMDDGLDDDEEAEDRDEYKSGSTNHDTYENPSFGESRRAARDGDDIESFFDKHLGPQDAIENRDDNEIPINETPLRGSSREDVDDDEQYEAAASGPLATIISSIINRRPIVITATTGGDSSSPSDSKASASSDDKQTQSPEESPATAMSDGSAGPEVPIGHFLVPMVASSSNAYDEQDNREAMYVSRRPAALEHKQYQLHPTGHQLSYAKPVKGAASHRQPMIKQHPHHYISHYQPMASHAYQRNRAQPEAAAEEDDDQTVSYNLSFGGGSGVVGEPADDQVGADEAASYDGRPLAGYSSMRTYSPMMMMVTPAEQQRYYQQQQQQQQAMMLHQQQHPVQMARGGARYHRDPSESADESQYVKYRQSSMPQQQTRQDTLARSRNESRDQLLASLDEQIKANPNYWHQAASSINRSKASPVQEALTPVGNSSGQAKNGSNWMAASPSTDVDTYSSYHSEIGPHKALTTTSHLATGRPPVIQEDVAIYSTRDPTLNDSLLSAYSVGDLLRKNQPTSDGLRMANANSRVRREDSEERDNDDADDGDGVWVDDDEDDDNRQQSSDLNETSQDPESDDDETGVQADPQQEDSNEHRAAINPPVSGGSNMPRGMHGYEISPDDLMVYPPSVM